MFLGPSHQGDEISMPENVSITDDEPVEQEGAPAIAEPDVAAFDVAQPAPPTKLPMSPTQALTTHFDVETESDRPGQSGKTSLANSESRQGFKVGDLSIMIRNDEASELAEMPALHRLPNTPEWFCGMANMHGKLIPVFDLARFLAVDHDPQAKRMLLVLSRGSDATGVLIDGLPERLRLTDDIQADVDTAPQLLAPHLRGIALIGERLWFDLNTNALLDTIEQSLATLH